MKKILVTIFVFILFAHVASATTLIHYSSLRKMLAPRLSTSLINRSYIRDVSLNALTSSTTVISGSSSGSQTINDVNYDVHTSSTVRNFCSQLSAQGVDGNGNSGSVVYGSQNTSVATINSSTGMITYVGDGTTYLTARYGTITRGFVCQFITNVGGTSYIFNSLVSSSLAQHIINQIDAKLVGLSPSATTQNIYSSTNDTTKTYVRNANHFASTTDLTSAAAYSDSTGTQEDGVLVAPDIMIFANHAYPSSGNIYFVTSTSTTITRSVSSSMNIAGTDIQVARLNTPLTYGVTFAKVLTSSSTGIYGSVTDGNKITNSAVNYNPIPAVFIPQDRKIYIGTVPSLFSNTFSLTTPYKICNSSDYTGKYGGWYRLIVGGDSGTPSYFIINNEAVAIGVWYSSCAPSNISRSVAAINTAMTSLGSAYQLTTVDLSGFPTY